MRITSTTSVPVRAKEITAAGPAEPMTTPLPTKSPAPMTPPSAIICMWRRRSERRSPSGAGTCAGIACSPASGVRVEGTQPALHEFLVFLEVAHGRRERVTPERITELLRHHHLQHRGLAVALRPGSGPQRRRDVSGVLNDQAFAAEGSRHGGPAGVLEIDSLIAPRIEVDMVLLFRAP